MKFKIIISLFFVFVSNFAFAEPPDLNHYKALIERFGPVPPVFYEAHKRNTAGEGTIPRLMKVIKGFPGYLLRFIGYRVYDADRGISAKSCFSNQRVLMGAIEMYNMDHEAEMIDSMVDPDAIMRKLISEGYSKASLICYQNGIYRSYGRFQDGGIIFCDLHGPPDGKNFLLAAGMIKPDSIWDELMPLILLVVLAGAAVFSLVKIYYVYKTDRSGVGAKTHN
ncbi:MAG: hypothetical protein PHF08_11820 [Candidatus Riflebacteria bacterium]|nr:hypothetical protein [Candidatus Riflebacteria bacterium]NCB46632.1 hypothetical protein [bacterium]